MAPNRGLYQTRERWERCHRFDMWVMATDVPGTVETAPVQWTEHRLMSCWVTGTEEGVLRKLPATSGHYRTAWAPVRRRSQVACSPQTCNFVNVAYFLILRVKHVFVCNCYFTRPRWTLRHVEKCPSHPLMSSLIAAKQPQQAYHAVRIVHVDGIYVLRTQSSQTCPTAGSQEGRLVWMPSQQGAGLSRWGISRSIVESDQVAASQNDKLQSAIVKRRREFLWSDLYLPFSRSEVKDREKSDVP